MDVFVPVGGFPRSAPVNQRPRTVAGTPGSGFSGTRRAACVSAYGLGTRPDMSTPNPDPRIRADLDDEPDFADEHAELTHADEHPVGEDLETDESTPSGSSGMD